MIDLSPYNLIRLPRQECEDCAGTGEHEQVVRWRDPYMGGAEPVYARDECGSCRGEGWEICHSHRIGREHVIACHADERSDVYCRACIRRLIDELQQAERETDLHWSGALEVQEAIETLKAILTAYDMEEVGA